MDFCCTAPGLQTSEPGAVLFPVRWQFLPLVVFLKKNIVKYLRIVHTLCIFVLSKQRGNNAALKIKKATTMLPATQYFKVQDALGFSDRSPVTRTNFAALDAQYKADGRLIDESKTLPTGVTVRGIFVDGALVMVTANGTEVSTDEAKLRNILGI